MKNIFPSPALLLLEDGTRFYGRSSRAKGTATGEICFNTGMTGYQEIFTDPSYYGQLLVTTHVHIGNYGIHADEVESDSIKITGLICRTLSNGYSRYAAKQGLEDYFISENKPAFSGFDTRAIVRHIRSKGAMNAIVSSDILDLQELKCELNNCPSMDGLELASKVTTRTPYFLGDSKARYRIAVMDYGVKKNILRHLLSRHCYLQVFPASTNFEQVKKWNPDGILLSNGPGDPATMNKEVEVVRQVLNSNIPLMGICLGHQLLARACGLTTYKMHHGHRGINHPVKNLVSGQCEITSQNHGFAVEPKSIGKDSIEVTHINLNDQTIEGIRVVDKPAFSVQYHPESAPGPHDSVYLFDRFVESIAAVSQAV